MVMVQKLKQKENKRIGIREYLIRELHEYIDHIDRYYAAENYYLFRGQREDWNLLPKLSRLSPMHSIFETEKSIFRDFNLESAPYLNPLPQNDWDRLAIAQHHGVPTRLLDWTKNPLAALWFAVRDTPVNLKKHGVVWIFKPESKDIIDDTQKSDPFRGTRTKVFEPTHVTTRIKAQDGVFTIHKYIDRIDDFIAFNNQQVYKRRLEKIKVPTSKFARIRTQLHRCGVHSASMFPDLDGLASFVTWRHSMQDDEVED